MKLKKLWLVLPALCLLPLAAASAQVPGSYRQSCRNIEQYGSNLMANCKAPGGRWQHSSLDLRQCGGQGVANAYGVLTCGNVQGSAEPAGRGGGGRGGGGGYGDNGYDDGRGAPRYRTPDYPPRNNYGGDDYAPRRPRYAPQDDDNY